MAEESAQDDAPLSHGQSFGIFGDNGQALVETGLLLALIALLCVAAVTTFGAAVVVLYDRIITAWP